MKCFSPKKKTGFTLTELAITLLIMVLLFGSIWAVANTIEKGASTKRAIEDTHAIAKNIQEYYNFQKTVSASTDLTPELISKGVFPLVVMGGDKTGTSGGKPRNPWGQQYFVRADSTGTAFILYSRTSDQGLCSRYVIGMKGAAGIMGIIHSTSPSTAISPYDGITASEIVTNTACSGSGPYYAGFKFHLRQADYAP